MGSLSVKNASGKFSRLGTFKYYSTITLKFLIIGHTLFVRFLNIRLLTQGREVASWKKDPPGPARFDSTNATSTPSPAFRPAQPGNCQSQSHSHRPVQPGNCQSQSQSHRPAQPSNCQSQCPSHRPAQPESHKVIVIDQPSQVSVSH
jgi:hypothetical protein